MTHSNSHRSLGDSRDVRNVRDAQDLQVGGDSLSHTIYVKNNSSSSSRLALQQLAAMKEQEQEQEEEEEEEEEGVDEREGEPVRWLDEEEEIEASGSDRLRVSQPSYNDADISPFNLTLPYSSDIPLTSTDDIRPYDPSDSPNYRDLDNRDLEDSLNGFQSPFSRNKNKSSPHQLNKSVSKSNFKTPILPSGKILKIEIYSTWGDDLYVGLNGLDIFDNMGNLISNCISSKGQLTSIISVKRENNSTDISEEFQNEFQNDPREVSNLLNGTNFTRNDLHVWLAPLGTQRGNENRNENASYSDKDGNIIVDKDKSSRRGSDIHDNDGDKENNHNNINHDTGRSGDKKNEFNDEKYGGLITSINIEFSQIIAISLIRIFNYNKSRTHCTRGVRDCVLKLDGVVIFRG